MPCVGSKKRHSLYLNPVIVDTFSFFFSPSLVYYMLWSNIWNNIWMKKRVPVALSDEWKLWYQHHLFFRQEASLCFVLAHDPQYTFHSLPWKNRIPSFFVCVFDLIFDLLHTIVRLFFLTLKNIEAYVCVCTRKRARPCGRPAVMTIAGPWMKRPIVISVNLPPLDGHRRGGFDVHYYHCDDDFPFFFFIIIYFRRRKMLKECVPFFFLLLFLSFKSHTFEKKTKFTITLIDDGDLWNCEADANDVTQFFWSKLLYTIPEMDTLQ